MFSKESLYLLNSCLGTYLRETHIKAKERTKWNCICGSSDGLEFNPDKDPCSWHCFVCGGGGDLIQLYAYDNSLDNQGDFMGIATDLARRYGVELAEPGADRREAQPAPKAKALKTAPNQEQEREQEQDNKNFISVTAEVLANPKSDEKGLVREVRDYLEQRGIEQATWERFGLGVTVDKCSLTRLVIPSSDRSACNMRLVNNDFIKQGFAKYMRRGKACLFEALQEPSQERQPCWIVEGELDALSIWQAGGSAIATASANNTRLAIDYARANREKYSSFVLYFDADKAGQEATKATLEALAAAKIPCYAWPRTNGDTRDANDILRADKANSGEAYGAELVGMVEQAKRQGALTAEALARLQALDGANAFETALTRIKQGIYSVHYATPFPQLNAALYGGLHPGLVILGATTGAGKTTMALQLASFFAEKGNRVLYVSLEMAAVELYTRIISRLAGEKGVKVSALALRAEFDSWQGYGAVTNAISRFRTYIAPRFNVVEGVGNFSAIQAAELAEHYAKRDGKAPIIVVDYLQMLASPSAKLTDKQATDASILTLKRLSRDLNTLVLAISSYNRGSYNAEASLSAFKESGAIEYTADLVLALEAPQDAEPSGETRDITLSCLKNRDGKRFKLSYSYTPAINRFDEEGAMQTAIRVPRL